MANERTGIKYIGKEPYYKDRFLGTGLVWKQGETLPIPVELAKDFLKHSAIFQEVPGFTYLGVATSPDGENRIYAGEQDVTGQIGGGFYPGPTTIQRYVEIMYPDPDAEAAIAAAGVTDTIGKTNYRTVIAAIKSLGLWSGLSNGFLLGSKHQSSASTLKSIKAGAADAAGSGTNAEYGVSLNGSTNGYLYPAASASAAKTEKTLIAIFADTSAVAHVGAVLSGYQGGTTRGPYISAGGSPISGNSLSTIKRVYGYASIDGAAASPEMYADNASVGGIVYSALRLRGGYLSLNVQGKELINSALATAWQNNPNIGIGKHPNNAHYFSGAIYAVLEFDVGLTDTQLYALMRVLRHIYSIAVAPQRYILFMGNSLTATSSNGGVAGGGSDWPAKLRQKAAWLAAYPDTSFANTALGGSRVSAYGELDYHMRGRMWSPIVGERSICFAWDGCNDITGGVSADVIIAAKNRLYSQVVRDGWELYVLPITPVASQGQGMSYGWTPAQQSARDKVNAWQAKQTWFKNIDLSKIGVTNPTFLDPTSSDYYVAGDGLHHNNSGRALIADYIASVVTP